MSASAALAVAEPEASSPTLHKASFHEIRGVHSIPIQSISCGYNHTAVIAGPPPKPPFSSLTLSNRLVESTSSVYSWGINNKSQLGHGSADMEHKALPKLISRFATLKIRQVACGGSHTAAVDTSFGLWTWGDGSFGQLCQGDETSFLSPRKVPDLKEPVKYVACGFYHTAAIIDTRLYTCGQGMQWVSSFPPFISKTF